MSAALSDSTFTTAQGAQGELYLNLSDLLAGIKTNLNRLTNDGAVSTLYYKQVNLELSTITLPTTDLSKFFDINTFNANYFAAFNESFPPSCRSSILFSVRIYISNNLPFGPQPTLIPDEYPAFRMLVCLLLGLLFNIQLTDCACYPKNVNELKAVNAGIGLNCISLECKSQLKMYPMVYDDLIHTPCDSNINAAFVSLNLFSGGVMNVDINISQRSGLGLAHSLYKKGHFDFGRILKKTPKIVY